MFFADVIMPFTAIYFAAIWFFPINILALGSEVAVFAIAYRKLPPETVIGYTLAANGVSFLVGGFLACLVSVFIQARKGFFWSGSDPTYPYYIWCGIFFAFLLSIYIELHVWQRLTKRRSLPRLDKMCVLANFVSYVVIVGAAQIMFEPF